MSHHHRCIEHSYLYQRRLQPAISHFKDMDYKEESVRMSQALDREMNFYLTLCPSVCVNLWFSVLTSW